MKSQNIAVFFLLLLSFHPHVSQAKGGKGWKSSKKTVSSNKNTGNTAKNHNHGSNSGHTHHGGGGYPRQSGGGYPRQGGGGYGTYGGNHGYGSYPGTYVNRNPNNDILSPHYRSGFLGANTKGGSPFSQTVRNYGYYPNSKSKGFGRSAVAAASGGAVAGMAVGYGLGGIPRPHFRFHSPREEYYYNQHMYRTHRTESSQGHNTYKQTPYSYQPPPHSYKSFMDSCMKRDDLLPMSAENTKPESVAGFVTSAQTNKSVIERDTAQSNSSVAGNVPTSALPSPTNLAKDTAEDDTTVSIVEIGYPALIEQMKVQKCVEMYVVYSERYQEQLAAGAPGLTIGCPGLGAAFQGFLGTLLMLTISIMLTSPCFEV